MENLQPTFNGFFDLPKEREDSSSSSDLTDLTATPPFSEDKLSNKEALLVPIQLPSNDEPFNPNDLL